MARSVHPAVAKSFESRSSGILVPRGSSSGTGTGTGQATIGRRAFLRNLAAAGGIAAFPALLSACGGGGGDASGSAATGATGGSEAAGGGEIGTVTVGSNYSDQVPRDALAEVFSAFESDNPGATVDVNTVDHNTFQEQINNYLQGRPDDVFSWFAGYRMQFFAERGLATPITDVWEEIGGSYSDALKQASTAQDDQFFIPFYYYPWAVFYRPSVFEERGYETPTTLDEFVTLCESMQSDGLVPIAFADQDGWPAMGTFDYLNMRINGFDYHMSLMAGEEAWDSAEVKEVFNTWAELLPFHQEAALGRTWQEAAQSLVNKESGMYLLGMFVGQQFVDQDPDDLDFFAFPEINSEHGQKAVEAPIDGWMLAREPENEAGAKALLRYMATAEAQQTYLGSDPNNIAASDDADTSNYSALQQKAVELIGAAESISQFMDRDTRPDFASTVMIPALQEFIQNQDTDTVTRQIEQQKQTIFTS
ncbi:MAG TPA: ABC transporter substrate-binding protein [Euzebyales bacterium]|nr:ABC transporter substrate-binding protein [Euzebyales bacterium]